MKDFRFIDLFVGIGGFHQAASATAYRLVAESKILGFKVGSSWRFQRNEIDKWINKQSCRGKAVRLNKG